MNPINLNTLCSEAKIPRDKVIVEKLPTLVFIPIGSNVPIEDLLKDPAEQAKVVKISPRLYDEDTGKTQFLLSDRSSILYSLANLQLHMALLHKSSEGYNIPVFLIRIIRLRYNNITIRHP